MSNARNKVVPLLKIRATLQVGDLCTGMKSSVLYLTDG